MSFSYWPYKSAFCVWTELYKFAANFALKKSLSSVFAGSRFANLFAAQHFAELCDCSRTVSDICLSSFRPRIEGTPVVAALSVAQRLSQGSD